MSNDQFLWADVVSLIRIWLTKRLLYVLINSDDSYLIASNTGTTHGSILGPILCAIFVSPIIDLENHQIMPMIIILLGGTQTFWSWSMTWKKSLDAITKWLRDSGLTVNEMKTEMCMFQCNQNKIVTLNFIGTVIKSTPQIKVVGIIFDSKL